MEKRGILNSFDEWKRLREIRNLFAHDYPETDEEKAEALYRPLVKSSHFACAKVPGLNDHKSPNIRNMGATYDRSTAGAFALAKWVIFTRGRYKHSIYKFFEINRNH